ncbi:hypothetical protein [Phaeacidiphilus oryzae]|uniref:hypothetical protein n=1 Tax=Phaeacidiphilus oryzae TaxID=348818 RepID=UPI000A065946|nr:hypothetical protein [Phaeacidiphilus oryzae]
MTPRQNAVHRPGLTRRAVLAGATGGLLAACGGNGGEGGRGTPAAGASPGSAAASGRPSPSPSSSPSRGSSLPVTTPWRAGPGEIQPQVKARATQIVEALGGWASGHGGRAEARARLSALGVDPALADQAGGLRPAADSAALAVVDAQYGGILPDSASVLVVCRQWTSSSPGAPVTAGGTTVDVRLTAASPAWRVTALHPAVPGPPLAAPPALVREVLANRRILLPPDGVADLRSGRIHDSVLTAMLTLSRRYTLEVSVVRSGHPIDVFGTSRPSDHPRGRAFDTWRIDGRAVVDPATPKSLVDGYMRAAAAAGSYNVGGPRLLSGSQFFSDDTHHDHVHAGFLT